MDKVVQKFRAGRRLLIEIMKFIFKFLLILIVFGSFFLMRITIRNIQKKFLK